MMSSRLNALPHPAKQTIVFFAVMAAFLGKKTMMMKTLKG